MTTSGLSSGRLVLALVLAGLLAVASHVSLGLLVRAGHDESQFVSQGRLSAALVTFRPPGRPGGTRPVSTEDLSPERAVRTQPETCSALTLLTQDPPVDGASWTGANGSPAQPVNLLVVRYADADESRRALTAKRIALLRCSHVRLTFPPFTEPAQDFVVHGAPRSLLSRTDRLTYVLQGPRPAAYTFYVRRYANVVIWSYANDVSTPRVRQQVVDGLADRLRDIARER